MEREREKRGAVSLWVQNMCVWFVAHSTYHLIDTISVFCLLQSCFLLGEKLGAIEVETEKQLWWVGRKSGPAAAEGAGTVELQYGLVPSMGKLRKDTSLPYILHLALGSGRQPYPRFSVSPCAIHPRLNSISASLSHHSPSVPALQHIIQSGLHSQAGEAHWKN